MNPHDADNAMAGDYVMGLLDDAEDAAAEQRIATDQSFPQAVSAWRERLRDLDLVKPPGIAEAIDWARQIGRDEHGALEVRPLRLFQPGSAKA